MSRSKRFEPFTHDEINLIQEALAAYTDSVIADDDFYAETNEQEELAEIRDRLLKETS